MRLARPRTILFALSLALLAVPAQAQQKTRGDRNKLTKDDIAEAPGSVMTALDAVRVLRPLWTQPPMGRTALAGGNGSSGGGATEVIVYVDDMRRPSLDELRSVKREAIVEMKFLDQNRAIQMKGPGHELGAIEVTTVNKKK